MTRTDLNNFKRLAKMLRKAQDLADKLDATLDNGGEVGGIADEIELKCSRVDGADVW